MIFFFPTTRCARHLPHKNQQGFVPAVIPVEKLVQAELWWMSGHFFAPRQHAVREPAAPAKCREACIRPLLLEGIVRRFRMLENR
jgi:hypothetical protein